MSDENDVNVELEAEAENPLANMIDFTRNGEFNKANEIFNDVMNQRIQNALDQAKVAVSSSVFNQDDEDDAIELDNDDDEISDEELDAAAEDIADEFDAEEDYDERAV